MWCVDKFTFSQWIFEFPCTGTGICSIVPMVGVFGNCKDKLGFDGGAIQNDIIVGESRLPPLKNSCIVFVFVLCTHSSSV